ncbi:MAG: hypothetical protein WBA41_34160 [Rivularia sp. (in: cyanobacteria)]
MQCQEKPLNTKRIPRWLAKFILLKTQNNLHNQQKLFTLLEPMTPQEWCYFWIPIIHPGVEIPERWGTESSWLHESLYGNVISINRLQPFILLKVGFMVSHIIIR